MRLIIPDIIIGRFTLRTRLDMGGTYIFDDQKNLISISREESAKLGLTLIFEGEEVVKELLEQTFIRADET